MTQALAKLPLVTAVATAPDLLVVPIGSNGRPLSSAVNNDYVSAVGSIGGEYFTNAVIAWVQISRDTPLDLAHLHCRAICTDLGPVATHLGSVKPHRQNRVCTF